MFHFSHPSFLWALSGLAIPIGIHLLSRKDGKIIRMGTLRHLQETSTRQFRGIKLNEITLLVLRCLLILLFVLLISGLEWNINPTQNKKWMVVESGLQYTTPIRSAIDSFESKGYEAHLLSNNFPLLSDTTSAASEVSYPLLASELAKKNLDEVIVFSYSKLRNYTGEHIALAPNIRWISEPAPAEKFVLQTTSMAHDSVLTRIGNSSPEGFDFISIKSGRIDTVKASPPDTLSVVLMYEPTFTFDAKIIKAALLSLNGPAVILNLRERQVIEGNPGNSHTMLIWLSKTKYPDGYLKTIYSDVSTSSDLLTQHSETTWALTHRLNEAIALKENLTLKLADILIPRQKLQSLAGKHDIRVLSDTIAWIHTDGQFRPIEAAINYQPLGAAVIILFLLIAIAERLLSYKRNQ